ncbi:MAG TPA: hypothetical protein VFH80_33890 [Solirubrobacteraceae bacterium]|nr:hypothetical protein [Solirubrobacteraceae bacterium]
MGVTLQINLAPPDVLHAVHVAPHQLRVWGDQVDEVLFTLDAVRPSAGRFAERWNELLPAMNELLERLEREHRHARVDVVDASPATVSRVAARFFAGEWIPMKDSRGGPLYAYFYGLHRAENELVLHVDSDMLFGGGSQTWVQEAVAAIRADDSVLLAGPLPGPPRVDGRLCGQPDARPEPGLRRAFRFHSMSTRVFLLDRARLSERVGALPLAPPLLFRSRVKALINRNPMVAMPEQILTREMRRHRLARVDFLGEDPGMWSLHPPYRSSEFYRALPGLIARVEANDLPDEQRGHYDFVDALFDFSEVRAKLSRSPLAR